jgi:Right handed beta helix region
LRAGDTVSFAAGETWNQPLLISAHGSASAPVVVRSYGKGSAPVFTGSEREACVELQGAHLVLRGLRISSCHFGIRIFGQDVRVMATAINNTAEGLRTEPGSSRAVVSGNIFTNNDKMVVDTPCSEDCTDDYGAIAVLVAGNGGRFSQNTIVGSYATSHDWGHDGSAFEIYGGSDNSVDHNLARQNADFIEVGCNCSSRPAVNNQIEYNVITSTLGFGVTGIEAHGNESFGPAYGTKVYNNSIYITSPRAEALRCGSCTAAMMKLRNNAVRMTGSGSGFNYSGADEDYDLLSGKPIWEGTRGPHSRAANPRFRSVTNLRLQRGSPAVKRGLNLGPARDFAGVMVRGIRDIGAYKFRNHSRHRAPH